MKRKCLIAAAAISLTACATQPDEIQTASVSTLQYMNHDCGQLSLEADRISTRTNELYHNLKKTADNDEVQMGVGLILLWPTLFFLEGGDGPEAQEYARLKGEREAIEKVAIQKKCSIQFQSITKAENKS